MDRIIKVSCETSSAVGELEISSVHRPVCVGVVHSAAHAEELLDNPRGGICQLRMLSQ